MICILCLCKLLTKQLPIDFCFYRQPWSWHHGFWVDWAVTRYARGGATDSDLECPRKFDTTERSSVARCRNDSPKGFGANHNAAFMLCNQEFFCPLNPDISFSEDPFVVLLEVAQSLPSKAIIAPLIRSPDGQLEDSARYFPTLISLLRKLLGNHDGRFLFSGTDLYFPEWVAGMFMLFRRNDFAELAGFDEGFFLYYEDVDICVRAWKAGMRVVVCSGASVVHAAQRDSHRSFRHMRWHISSMARYFYKYWGRLPSVPRA